MGYWSKPDQMTNCQYLSQLLLQLISCVFLWPHFIPLQTHKYFVSPMLEQKPLANAVSPTALPSDICHIQSSHPFKIALKIHLYRQYHNKWFQILSSCLQKGREYNETWGRGSLPHVSLYSLLFCVPMHACICIHACVHCVCVCVSMSGCDVWGTYTMLWLYNYHFWGFSCTHFLLIL